MTLTDTIIAALEKLGWEYVPTGPNEYEWLKFSTEGTVVAHGGDPVWQHDIKEIRNAA